MSEQEMTLWLLVDLALVILYVGALGLLMVTVVMPILERLEDIIVRRDSDDSANQDVVSVVPEDDRPLDLASYRNLHPQFPGGGWDRN